MDIGADTDSEYDSEEKEFWFVFPFIGKMAAYFQWHYDKRSQRTSILSGSDYMAEVRDGNPTNCHDMFRMTLDLFYHLVDELKHYEYLKEGKGCVDVQETVAIFLYIVGHNTRMRPMADRFQHSTETVDRKFRRVLQAVHTYGQHLIKPDPNVVGLPENLRGNNKYDPWFERSIGAIDGTHISAQPSAIAFTDILYAIVYLCDGCAILVGFYYLVDSGYPIGASFLPPHKATRYHAQEFRRRSTRQPKLGKELFNYRHSSLRMVIERAFGVLKARFPILSNMAKYKQYRQHLVVSTCCALHNFIRINNRRDVLFNTWENLDVERDDMQTRNNGNSLESSVSAKRRHVREMSNVSKRAMGEFKNDMTDHMWEEYV
ncbi:uncharacterized protein LOC112000257 [Quercus suber]|uniref:uncharacterized protein LOC112000257 n=1 Tax=Quercus suber TaxID=58331 RepID=UPI000CE2104F|nr:uncharacterized protein LOC112000257 [Quercus suber]